MSRRRGRGGKNRPHQNHQQGGQGGQGGQGEHGRSDSNNQSQKSNQAHSHAQNRSSQTNQVDRNQHGKSSFQSAVQPRRTLNRPSTETSVAPKTPTKRYQVIFFDTLAQAKSDLAQLQQMASACDHLNIVVRAEANMDDADLLSVGKLFCGAAWSLIHERRKTEGWYDKLQE